jgi:uncharacterized LabA/DUF88 family protein
MPRVAVFLDGANFFFMQKDRLKWFADPKKILAYVSRFGDIIAAYYYVGQETPPEAKDKAYLDALVKMGFSLVTKPVKTIYDQDTGNEKKKANLDIEIVLDMFSTINNYDMAILISGDGDFERPLQLLKANGKSFKVISTAGSVAYELRAVAGLNYIDFRDIRNEVAK